MNLSYELIKHVKRNLSLSAILTAKDIYGMIDIIVDYRVGKFPFSVNISAMLLTRCGSMVPQR